MHTITDAAAYTLNFINQTQQSVFLTGKAGTGKTTLLREIIRTTHKHTVVVAPTGIAALNAGGVTIHSMFQLPFAGFIPDHLNTHFSETVKFENKNTLNRHFRMSSQKKAVIQNMELLIIDEVSMLRADLLDAIDFMMQSVRRNKRPFGGVQGLYIGDLLQLPPVIKEDEWRILKQYYKGKFFFHSHVVQQYPPLYIELSKIFRQTDGEFIGILNNLRNNSISKEDVGVLNQFVKRDFDLEKNKGYIVLTTHNAKADEINARSLANLQGKVFTYTPEITGEFPEKIFPVDANLQLKVGAQVMFVKNDPSAEKNYFNGKMGVVQSLSEAEILVHFPDENKTIEIERYEWENIKYAVNHESKEIEEEILGTFVHYPIKLAWAITVHKSQGLTFDKAALDVSQVFLPGQAYVALSRLRSLNGLILLSPLQMNGISNDQDVMDYATHKADDTVLEHTLKSETRKFIHDYLKSGFTWDELAQEWRNHQFSYQPDAEKSTKTGHAEWAAQMSGIIWKLLEPAGKFKSQLDKLFRDETADFNFISERVNAAIDYFMPVMDKLVYDLLWKLEEISRIKKSKTLYEEVAILEDLQVKAVQRLMKTRLLIEAVISGQPICKETMHSEAIKQYKNNKSTMVRNDFKSANYALVDDDHDDTRYTPKKKSKKEPKKSTISETYELWMQKNSVKEIAEIRKLTPQTINTHLAKLVESKAISITEVLPQDKIRELADAFKDHQEETLGALKERCGDRFTWDELRLFKAAVNAES
ncbi:MAG: helicase [Flavobacterium sp. BFFFF1]|uniref:helix-turn-helix domain-containing protein n=1 Tax=Flavobacterium sp. BFFFF1 TaxID=2015557 RepID=UPI000BDAC915|nr:helix-turn-helix domain-containing protein [Flavobacterium sp. BFFFF1]OYU81364.1 MAG: helicase [Flavobacterium sp. BFFFF1]